MQAYIKKLSSIDVRGDENKTDVIFNLNGITYTYINTKDTNILSFNDTV